MDIEAKKNILLSIIAATEKEEIIEELITVAWGKETEPVVTKSIVQKEGKPPRSFGPRVPVTVHGQTFKSVRHACLTGWGLDEKAYNEVLKQMRNHNVALEDLLKKKSEPARRKVDVDHSGLVRI